MWKVDAPALWPMIGHSGRYRAPLRWNEITPDTISPALIRRYFNYREALMIWTTATPPTVGAFPASTERNADARRYWNGRRWSAPWHVTDPAEIVDRAQRAPARTEGDRVEWLANATR